MEKITSFTIDHIKLQPGLYVSRKDKVGAETVTTFDLRLTSPNEEPVMNTAEMHIWRRHICATSLLGRIRCCILALWAAVPAFICCYLGIMNPKMCWNW